MLLPNKFFTYDESVLPLLPLLLRLLPVRGMTARELYSALRERRQGTTPTHFLDAVDALYALGKIEYDEEKGEIRHAL